MPTYPRWINPDHEINLREVGPGLYVGGRKAPGAMDWALVVDMIGQSRSPIYRYRYRDADEVLSVPMTDGDQIPSEALDAIYRAVILNTLDGPILLHCQAGLSRSASVAYAVLRRLFGLSHREALRRVKAHADFPMSLTLESARQWVEGLR